MCIFINKNIYRKMFYWHWLNVRGQRHSLFSGIKLNSESFRPKSQVKI